MDWIHIVAVIYLVVTTPLASLGLISILALGSAVISARGDRRKRDSDF